eukprot:8962857-Pyramimonas_sp.AAC.1
MATSPSNTAVSEEACSVSFCTPLPDHTAAPGSACGFCHAAAWQNPQGTCEGSVVRSDLPASSSSGTTPVCRGSRHRTCHSAL